MWGGYELPGACGGRGGGAEVAAAGGGVAAAPADGLKAASFSRVKSLNTGMRSGLRSDTQGFSYNIQISLCQCKN